MMNIVDNKMQKKALLNTSFKELPKFSMNDLQRKTMEILVEDDNKIEKLRGAKVDIIDDDDKVNTQNDKENEDNTKKEITTSNKLKKTQKSKIRKEELFHDGPISLGLNLPITFLEMNSRITSHMKTKEGSDGYTKPISVLMKLPAEPDPKIQKEIDNVEEKRDELEGNLFKKAKEEFKLITAMTTKELKINL